MAMAVATRWGIHPSVPQAAQKQRMNGLMKHHNEQIKEVPWIAAAGVHMHCLAYGLLLLVCTCTAWHMPGMLRCSQIAPKCSIPHMAALFRVVPTTAAKLEAKLQDRLKRKRKAEQQNDQEKVKHSR